MNSQFVIRTSNTAHVTRQDRTGWQLSEGDGGSAAWIVVV